MEFSEILDNQQELEYLINDNYEFIESQKQEIEYDNDYIIKELNPLTNENLDDLKRIVNDIHYRNGEIETALDEIRNFKYEYNELDKLKKEL